MRRASLVPQIGGTRRTAKSPRNRVKRAVNRLSPRRDNSMFSVGPIRTNAVCASTCRINWRFRQAEVSTGYFTKDQHGHDEAISGVSIHRNGIVESRDN